MTQSKRQLKFSKLIQKEISEIFQKEHSAKFIGSLVTVSDVSMSPDLGLARIYLSIFPVKSSEKIMEEIEAAKSKIRGSLGKRIGKEVRIIPHIAFHVDSTAEEAEKMDQIINKLNIPPANNNDTEE
ncbi:ribosome-binding factor A [Roseivirga ehrenbergii]|uniref:Ribosome-binding factor A n=1 Tax=Roseivirga ehrenbergii (strain DSM 102268 / JCM 13514 / KCTC 12282 / NCIMB 14502 / KMM 6017) TaxID=279360 RepID=A0A150XRT4_ROSEK|nr:30S ribosome-binding factor RbfA [Roseivirga ehrenbergii]KYG81423.1 ribosome-binding factor A [Roseivirga ehrenbergii]TCL10572.1 ribosome-binding factor A [Roseivirga ehrenbergii]